MNAVRFAGPLAAALVADWAARKVFASKFALGHDNDTGYYGTNFMPGMIQTGVCSNTAGCESGVIWFSSFTTPCSSGGWNPCGHGEYDAGYVGWPGSQWGRIRSVNSSGTRRVGERGNVVPGSPATWTWYSPLPSPRFQPYNRVLPNFDPMAQPVGRSAPLPVPVPPALAPYMPTTPEGSSRSSPSPSPVPRSDPSGMQRTPTGRPYIPRPAEPGTKERKFYTKGMQAAARLLDALTESIDALGAIWGAIPGNYDRWMSNGEPNAKAMAKDVYNNFGKIDWGQALINLGYEYAEDKAYGGAHGVMQDPKHHGGTDSPGQKARRAIGIILRHYM